MFDTLAVAQQLAGGGVDRDQADYLGGASGPGTVTVADNVAATVLAQQETVFWESIRDSSDPAEFEAYLRQYPAGAFRTLATVRLAALRPATADPSAADRPRPVARRPPATSGVVVVRAAEAGGRGRRACHVRWDRARLLSLVDRTRVVTSLADIDANATSLTVTDGTVRGNQPCVSG